MTPPAELTPGALDEIEETRRCYVCEAMTTTLNVCNGCFDKPADRLDELEAERDALAAKLGEAVRSLEWLSTNQPLDESVRGMVADTLARTGGAK